MSTGWQFLIVGAGTYAIRVLAIALVGRGVAIPPRVERTLRLIAPAVLAAIIVNSMVLDRGSLNPRASWLLGAAVAVLVVRRFRSAAWAMAVAMGVVGILQWAGVP